MSQSSCPLKWKLDKCAVAYIAAVENDDRSVRYCVFTRRQRSSKTRRGCEGGGLEGGKEGGIDLQNDA